MGQLLDKYKSALGNLSLVLAGLIVAIDPKHIDKFAESNPKWSGLIIAAWAAVIWWANKIKTQPQEPPGPQPMPPESQKQQYMQQSPNPHTGGSRRP